MDKYAATFPWQEFFPNTSLTFSKIPDISLTAVKFPGISRFSRQVVTLDADCGCCSHLEIRQVSVSVSLSLLLSLTSMLHQSMSSQCCYISHVALLTLLCFAAYWLYLEFICSYIYSNMWTLNLTYLTGTFRHSITNIFRLPWKYILSDIFQQQNTLCLKKMSKLWQAVVLSNMDWFW